MILLCSFALSAQTASSDSTVVIPKIELSEISSARVELIEYFRSDVQPLLQDSLMDQRRANLDTLRMRIDTLNELTEDVLENEQFSGTLDGLKLRWSELQGNLNPIVSELSSRNKSLEAIESELRLHRDAWSLIKEELDADDAKEEVSSRITVTLGRIDSVFEVVDFEFEETLEVESIATELILKIQSSIKTHEIFMRSTC